MLRLIEADGGIAVIKVSGRMSKSDYDEFVPQFERMAEVRRPVRILMELEDFHGWDLPALWEELKFDISHRHDFGRVAIVGAASWQEWSTRLSQPFFRAEMRFFPRDQAAEARTWLTQP